MQINDLKEMTAENIEMVSKYFGKDNAELIQAAVDGIERGDGGSADIQSKVSQAARRACHVLDASPADTIGFSVWGKISGLFDAVEDAFWGVDRDGIK